MTDLALRYSPDIGAFDLALDPASGDLVTDEGLTTAVIISLFTDRRARDDDALPALGVGGEAADRRGWWGDALTPESPLGSRLWLLEREKTTEATAARARTYVRESLEWLIRSGAAAALDVTASAHPAETRVEVQTTIERSGRGRESFRWRNLWEPVDAV